MAWTGTATSFALIATLTLAGCITSGSGVFSGADARIAAAVDGLHEERLCVPPPQDHSDDVLVKLHLDLEGDGEIRMIGHDGPPKVEEVVGKTSRLENQWYRGWNTGEICIDVILDARGDYAIAAYLD